MKIKTLELFGFKSFVDRTIFEFPTGITAVVGPNGCGKSNLVDAIRWSMGEMSAKHLRGRSMEDVIFTGSAKRPPVNLAEVTLTFSTEDGIVPPQYAGHSEISVTRRVDRDMESEYLINKVPCRLRDVLELFMGTGVGTKAYAIVEQGQIADLVSARAADRRALIEEAAGITKYKSRKNAALRKLESTEQNLVRVQDIVHEVRRQMSSLERQARRAERYKKLRDELRQLDLDLAARQFRALEREVSERRDTLAALRREQESLSATIASREGEAETVRLELAGKERDLEQRQLQLFDLKSEIARSESRIDLLKKDRENVEGQKGRNLEEIVRLRDRRGGLEADLARVTKEQASVLEARQDKEKAQTEAEALLAQVIAREASLAEEINLAGEALTRTIAEHARAERALEDLRARRSEARERAETGELTLGEEQSRREALGAEIDAARARLEGSAAEKARLASAREDESGRLAALDREVAEREGAWRTGRERCLAKESRLASLKELERPDLLSELASRHNARDTTERKAMLAELGAMRRLTSQHDPDNEIPEDHWLYRFAKKHWFFGFGAYT
ncbi:MAG: chromosome segregation SMC family protein [Myxococcota bacterium]